MDYHQVLQIAAGVLAVILFIPMVLGVWKEGAEAQSCATWLLWGALDIVLTISIIEQRGNYLLPLGFTVGDLVLVVILLAKGRFKWGWFETVILMLVVGCMIVWKFAGPRPATVASTLGVCIALVPGLVAMWKKPDRKVGNIWAGYIVANGLGFFGGTAMTIEERFAPGMFVLCSLAMFVASRSPQTNQISAPAKDKAPV